MDAAANHASTLADGHPVAAYARVGPSHTTTYAWYVAGLLSLAQIVSVMDRYLLSVVLESVKRDLALTDTQLGLLQGPSFVLLFTLASLPFGRLADFVNRRMIIGFGLVFWSVATASCAFAVTFTELMFARLAVGLGEAALMPAAMSLLVAYFSNDKLNRGMAVYSMGSSLGRAAGFAGGGAVFAYFAARGGLRLLALGHFTAWHAVFLVAGGVGVLAALVFLISVREPPRSVGVISGWDFRGGLRHFWHHRWAYLAVFVPFGMVNAMTQQLAAWTVSFYQRQHGLAVAAASALVGTTSLLCGPAGHLSGGWLTDRLGIRGVRGTQPVVLGAILLVAPLFIVLFALAPSVPLAAMSFGISYFLMSAAGPTGYGGSQAPTPDEHRGVISAVFLMFFMVLGAGLGPLAAGLVGDHVFQGKAKLGSAIILTTLLFALVGLPFTVLGRGAFDHAVIKNR
jgi:MFS family permease